MPKAFDMRAVVAVAVVAMACSGEVHVIKITSKNADTAEGYRYYLSRPYIAVKQEFPYDSKDVYLQATIVNVGGAAFVRLDDADLEKLGLSPGAALVPAADVVAPPRGGLQGETGAGSGDGSGSGSEKGSDSGGGSGKDDGGKDGSGAGSGSDKASKDDPSSSESISTSASNGLVSIADGVFDIAYLPDFDEQYAINVKGKWANTELKLQFANGWMLQSVDQKVDNSAITSFLTEQAGKTLDVARAFAALTLKLPSGALQGETGAKVTVRLRVLTYVVPGLYPLAKPAEIARRCKRSYDDNGNELTGEKRRLARTKAPVASGAGNSATDCEELFHFHTRTETLVELLQVPDAKDKADAAAAGLMGDAQRALNGIDVEVVAVVPGKGTTPPTVTIKPGPGAKRTAPLKKKAADALHKADVFKNAKVLWDNETPT